MASSIGTGWKLLRSPGRIARYCGRVLDRVGFAEVLIDAVDLTDTIYAANHGQPAELSTAAQEVEQFDLELEAATGPPAPLFGAYFDAEAKMRALNDLVRSAATLLARDDTSVGYVNAFRAATRRQQPACTGCLPPTVGTSTGPADSSASGSARSAKSVSSTPRPEQRCR